MRPYDTIRRLAGFGNDKLRVVKAIDVVTDGQMDAWVRATLGDEPGKLGFSGHQTFPFRNGWLKKAVDAAREDPAVFSAPDAIVRLGVGKNMVQSIRHWGLASGVLDQKGTRAVEVSLLGAFLFESRDPYLEDPASLWLLHWMLASNARRAGAWYLAFNRYSRPEFTKDQMVQFVHESVLRTGAKVSVSSLARDVDCLVRMYLPSRGPRRGTLEETFDCPLGELGMLTSLRSGGFLRFNIGPKPTLPTEIVGFAMLNRWKRSGKEQRAVPFVEVLYGEGSPGQLFKLDEDSLLDYIYGVSELSDGAIQFDETAGLRQIYFGGEIEAGTFLHRYYERGMSL